MFDKPHRGVTYFGSWAEDTAPMYGARDAFRVLERTATLCGDQDMREDEQTHAALAYLAAYTVKRTACVEYWWALGDPDPLTRPQAVRSRLEGIRRMLPVELVAILAGLG